MTPPTLVIGNKNYSSWSLRPWLFMKKSGVPFEEIHIPLDQPGSVEELRQYSPSGLVSLLVDGDLKVWDSPAVRRILHRRTGSLALQKAKARR